MNTLAQQFRRALGKAFRHAPLAHAAAPPTLLDWGRWYLPHHFTKPSSLMHTWLATQLDRTRTERGLKINLIGPRGGAKSTVGTLAYVLRAVVEGKEPYIWIISDTKDQARSHLEAVKSELADNVRLRREYPHAAWAPLRWQRRRSGTGERRLNRSVWRRAAAARPAARRASPHADRVRRLAER